MAVKLKMSGYMDMITEYWTFPIYHYVFRNRMADMMMAQAIFSFSFF